MLGTSVESLVKQKKSVLGIFQKTMEDLAKINGKLQNKIEEGQQEITKLNQKIAVEEDAIQLAHREMQSTDKVIAKIYNIIN